MNNQTLDPAALLILDRLREDGFAAFAVGGCVRDLLMGRRPHDWDVATSARPEQVRALFDRTIPTGVSYGTVTVMVAQTAVQVATFRTEGAYSDGRRPDDVRFDADLTADLARRDFTVNAMALDAAGRIIDPFGGRADLDDRILRCVGHPRTRFAEDALRMWRALRFSATLGFEVERDTLDAVAACAPLTARLSAERVSAEMGKMLTSRGTARLSDALSMGLMNAFLEKRPSPSIRTSTETLEKLPCRPDCRWAGFAALLRRDGYLSETGAFLRALRLPNRVTMAAGCGVEWSLAHPMPADAAGWRRLCATYGVPAALCAASAADALKEGEPSMSAALQEVLRANPCLSTRDLALRGAQLKAAGFSGAEIGRVQRALLDHVLDHPEDDTREALWNLARNL